MINVDFYILTENTIENAYSFVCRLIDKAYQQKQAVFINTNSSQEAKTLDDLLWTFRDDAFIPHAIYGEIKDPAPLMQLGYNVIPENTQNILLNLTATIPDYADNFKRIIELVPAGPATKKISREKYRIYRERNYEIKTHDLTKN